MFLFLFSSYLYIKSFLEWKSAEKCRFFYTIKKLKSWYDICIIINIRQNADGTASERMLFLVLYVFFWTRGVLWYREGILNALAALMLKRLFEREKRDDFLFLLRVEEIIPWEFIFVIMDIISGNIVEWERSFCSRFFYSCGGFHTRCCVVIKG